MSEAANEPVLSVSQTINAQWSGETTSSAGLVGGASRVQRETIGADDDAEEPEAGRGRLN